MLRRALELACLEVRAREFGSSSDRNRNDSRGVPLSLRPDDDLDVAVEEGEEVHQAFGGEPAGGTARKVTRLNAREVTHPRRV
jgi:hypothetical protein